MFYLNWTTLSWPWYDTHIGWIDITHLCIFLSPSPRASSISLCEIIMLPGCEWAQPILSSLNQLKLLQTVLQVGTKQHWFTGNTKGVSIFGYQDAILTHNPDCSEYVVAPLVLTFNLFFLPLWSRAQVFLVWRDDSRVSHWCPASWWLLLTGRTTSASIEILLITKA